MGFIRCYKKGAKTTEFYNWFSCVLAELVILRKGLWSDSTMYGSPLISKWIQPGMLINRYKWFYMVINLTRVSLTVEGGAGWLK